MSRTVTSRFSVASTRLDADALSRYLPWKATEAESPNDNVDYFITVFDLGIGQHDRVDRHLERATDELFKKVAELEALHEDCRYTLWLSYRFPSSEGAVSISSVILSRLAHLRIDLMLDLNESQ